ncbi:MAG: NAD-dependent epimerase/dehydratase family protein [Planctomycetaceae bacterium]|nr:NAD-dependent epimerase/dehydratase family protein [Planctomycetaceae bacterium]
MKILVTGGAGFIGSHIVDALIAQGHCPVVVDNLSSGCKENLPADVPLHVVDVCDQAALEEVFEKEKPDLVCHQAAQMSVSLSVKKPSFDAQINILGLINTLELAQKYKVQKFVFASSGGVLYGNVTEPATEDYPANPISPYGISKWAGERYLQFFSQEHGLKTVALRYANVYGPRQNPHGEAGVVAIFCQRMLQGENTKINGDGKYIRDYVFVEDVAQANRLALLEDAPEIHSAFNVGTGRPTDVNELASELKSLCEKALQQRGLATQVPASDYGPARAGDLRSNLLDASRLQKLWGWSSGMEFNCGLAKTVEWFAAEKLDT